MSEIEKMYRTAKVVPSHHYCNECQYDMSAECPIRCPDNVAVYPPFTAEKQIELIKWLAIRFNSDYMSYWHNEIKDVWIFRLHDLTEFSSEEPCIYEGRNKDFTKALCNLINDLWQDLTEE